MRLQNGDESAFASLYDRYWSKLYAYVYNRIRSQEDTEELVQEVFIVLWENRQSIVITDSLSLYLFSILKRQLVSYFRSEKVKSVFAEHFAHFIQGQMDNSTDERWAVDDLQQRIEAAIAELPNKCQEVFWLSRKQQLSSLEIASQLQISQRTVENYLSRAVAHLKLQLGDVLVFWAFTYLFSAAL
ncbi:MULTISPECIES: RNA polymerase sigma factor [unclassified Siphonobacter]|uniref:RNA polymerase sigma factor n=1 Tax=Siphonobacter sp. BAB-5385 TaxID=1864822 RepID=UPI001E485275|nr:MULTISPECIES: RNA polymerase sigma-70 factor [unclassified Siphonobacter]